MNLDCKNNNPPIGGIQSLVKRTRGKEAFNIKFIPILMILGYLSCVDLKKREVPDLPVLALFIYAFFIVKDFKMSLIISLVVFAIHLIGAIISGGGIGGGDIKLMSVLAFALGEDFFLLVVPMAILMITTLIYGLLKGRGINFSVPFVPYIFLSFLIAWGIKRWIPLDILYY